MAQRGSEPVPVPPQPQRPHQLEGGAGRLVLGRDQPLPGVQRIQVHTTSYRIMMLWCWQVSPQSRDGPLQPVGLGPHQQGGLRPHRVQAGGLGGQVSDMSRGHDNVTLCCGRYYVCNYGEGGNVISRPVYRVGRPCSQCPDSTSCSYKYPGLCSRSSHV